MCRSCHWATRVHWTNAGCPQSIPPQPFFKTSACCYGYCCYWRFCCRCCFHCVVQNCAVPSRPPFATATTRNQHTCSKQMWRSSRQVTYNDLSSIEHAPSRPWKNDLQTRKAPPRQANHRPQHPKPDPPASARGQPNGFVRATKTPHRVASPDRRRPGDKDHRSAAKSRA